MVEPQHAAEPLTAPYRARPAYRGRRRDQLIAQPLIYGLDNHLVRRFDPFHVWLLVATAAGVAAVIAALAGSRTAVCLVILMLAPPVTVAGSEVRGDRHQAEALVN